MTDEINRWKVGNVKITRVVEMEGGFPPNGHGNDNGNDTAISPPSLWKTMRQRCFDGPKQPMRQHP